MSQSISIGQLTPNFKGNYLLRFQVAEVGSPLAQPHQINCKIVDQSGCINAYFNNYGKFIKQGGVYELVSFKCKVVDHSLRVQLRKDSKITRIKHQIGYRDLFNNLSQKFYVPKSALKSEEPLKSETDSAKNQEAKDGSLKNQKEIRKEQKVDNKQFLEQKTVKQTEKVANNVDQEKPKQKTDKLANNEHLKQEKNQPKKGEPNKKKVYIAKKAEESKISEGQQKEKQNQQERVLLKDIYKHRQRKVNLIVRIQPQTKIDCQTYHLIKVCDSSGSVYIQFESRINADDKSWYHLKNFTVYKDKIYGFIASQNKQSSCEILYDFHEKPDFRPIYFQNK